MNFQVTKVEIGKKENLSIYDLPESEKYYTVLLSDGLTFKITGEQKNKILASKDQFISAPNGEVFNRSFMRAIVLDKEKTKENALNKKLMKPEQQQEQVKTDWVFDEVKKVYKEIITK